ncbi:MAG: hypothetical protein WDZ68_00790 [Candidatus Paceibacterota bacterium]
MIFTSKEIKNVRVEKFSISTSLLIRAALRKGFHCAFLPEKAIKISNRRTSHLFKGTDLPCNNTVASGLASNKYFLRRLLKAEGLPAPRTITLRHPAAWQNVLKSTLEFPLVVKPVKASHANGASLNITTPEELKAAVIKAFTYVKKHNKGDRVLVEEFFTGHDLRLMVIGNQVVSTVRREPAYIIGDGHSTIRELIKDFNNEWYSPIKYDLPLCPIPVDTEVFRCLHKQNLTLHSILPREKKVYVRWNANVSTGGRASDITSKVHPNLIHLAIQVSKLSHLEIGGVDILCKDVSSPDVSAKNITILEINDSPGIDIHHFPVSGIGRDVAGAILDHIFQQNNPQQNVTDANIEKILDDIIRTEHTLAPLLVSNTQKTFSILDPHQTI